MKIDINVDDAVDELVSKKRRRESLDRAKKFQELLKLIEDGSFKFEQNGVDHPISPREEYISPQDRSSYNYGYLTESET